MMHGGDAVEVDDSSAACFGCGRGLARSHGKEKTDDGNLGYHRKGGVSEICLASARELVHGSEKLRRDRFLAFCWWADVDECD
jgi:hypothetical protein